MTQLLLPLSFNPQMTPEQFCVGPSNQEAWAWIHAWPDWPLPGLVVYGPSGCGKTHLGCVFEKMTGALWLKQETILKTTPSLLLERNRFFILEAADQVFTNTPAAELFLFHLYNVMKEQGGSLLLLARTPPAHWVCSLLDLASRLNALPAIPVQAPDDTLLAQVLNKLFQDYQLTLSETVLTYLIHHMERSFEEAQRLARHLNELSLREKRSITVDLCRRLFMKSGMTSGQQLSKCH